LAGGGVRLAGGGAGLATGSGAALAGGGAGLATGGGAALAGGGAGFTCSGGAGLDAGASLAREAVRCTCRSTAECVIGRGARPSQRGRAGLRCAGSQPLAPLATRGCAALTRAVPQCGHHEQAGARLGTVRRRSARPPGRRGPAPGQVLLQPGPDERPALHAVPPQLVPLALPGHQGCDGACARERK